MVVSSNPRFSKPIIEFSPDDGILGITSSGGAGHIMTMAAIEAEFRKQRPNRYYKAVDVIRSSFPPPLGSLMGRLTNGWNEAKKKGDIAKQEQILKGKIFGISRQRLADIIFFIPVFVSTFFRLLFNRKITHVIDTQPLATSAVLKAVRLINFLFCRKLRVTKIMTDLPTKEAIHYSAPSLRLSPADRKVYQLVSTCPLKPHNRETEEEYLQRQEAWWNENFGLSLMENQVRYADFPVRPAFKIWANKPKEERSSRLSIKINHPDELTKISDLLGEKCVHQPAVEGTERKNGKETVSFQVGDQAVVGMITLGSQAAQKTVNYVQNFVNVVKKKGESDTDYYFFVACGAYVKGKPSLFEDVYHICKDAGLPTNVKVIPLGFQDDEEFAPLMHRADFGIYGSGGMTCMEVNSVATGHVLVHSETEFSKSRLKHLPLRDLRSGLMKGFALWEKGNAEFQEQTRGARIVTPGDLFKKVLVNDQIVSRKCTITA